MKLVFAILAIIPFVYSMWTYALITKQRKKPLPAEVSDIYDEKRYQEFLTYKQDSRVPYLLQNAISLCLTLFILLGPFFSWMERFSTNMYVLAIVTYLIIDLVQTLIGFPFSYYVTFVIREKYGLNKQDFKGFMKDFGLNVIFDLVVSIPLYLGMTFVIKNIPSWTNNFSIGIGKACMLAGAIIGVLVVFIMAASFFSFFMLRQQYKFTEMEDGELKQKIVDLTKESKKKVQKIEVYDESKKSTSKNAFLLKLLWIRRFGIADNFLNENSERELLAVLSHEAGHLMHKKTILNYMKYVMIGVVFVAFVLFMANGSWIIPLVESLNQLYGITVTNTLLLENIAGLFMTPLTFCISFFNNYATRVEEYEADRNAVKNGYGEDLITTFKTLSSDELVDVNPHPLVEMLEFDHPGMYNRIKAIREEIIKTGK